MSRSDAAGRRPAVLTAAACALGLTLSACAPSPGTAPGVTAGSRSAVDALAARADQPPDPRFARVLEPRELVFPADHGPHPAFQTEWWYVTGNFDAVDGPGADAEDGRRFGLQWTVFRRALRPEDPGAPDGAAERSPWSTRQLYMGHFALTDPAGAGHRSVERYARGAAGLAGAQAEPFRVWLESWSLASAAGAERSAVDPALPFRLRAQHGTGAERLAVDLVLRSDEPIVLQGDRGFSRKGAEPGAASFYYSFTRLEAAGRIEIGDQRWTVRGNAWLDHEWSTSVLSARQTGWDWFSLQLDPRPGEEGTRELMMYQLRIADGGVDPASSGTLIEPDGSTVHLPHPAAELQVLDTWRSPVSGIEYPARWRLRVPSRELDLEVVPILPDQEMDISFRYWEGAVDVTGTAGGRPTAGRGYVELVGYGDPRP